MSKRSLDESNKSESREERWLRKMKMYEDKIIAKRRRHAEQLLVLPPVSGDVRIEEHLENVEDPSGRPTAPTIPEGMAPAEGMVSTEGMAPPETEVTSYVDPEAAAAYLLDDHGFDEYSQMTDTTACTSPISNTFGNVDEGSMDDFDPSLLRELGDVEKDPVEFGENLQVDVAARFQKILLEGLKKETKDDVMKKYLVPKNVPLVKSPTLNPEIAAMLVDTCKLRDKRLLAKQDQLGKALSALGKALTGLLKKTPDIPDVIRTLNDAGMLLADSHYTETDTRRSVIIPLIDKSLTDPFKDRKRDNFLFGDKLGDLVKDSRGIKKTGQLIQPSTSTNSNLNGKGPSFRGARRQRSGQMYYYRAGGSRAVTTGPAYQYQYPSRRRGVPAPLSHRQIALPVPPPPPAPARRPPPAPRPSTSRQM